MRTLPLFGENSRTCLANISAILYSESIRERTDGENDEFSVAGERVGNFLAKAVTGGCEKLNPSSPENGKIEPWEALSFMQNMFQAFARNVDFKELLKQNHRFSFDTKSEESSDPNGRDYWDLVLRKKD